MPTTNTIAPIYSEVIDVTAGRRHQIFPDPLAEILDQYDESDVFTLVAERAWIAELELYNGVDPINVDLANLTVTDMHIAAEGDAITAPLKLAGQDVPSTVTVIDAPNGIIQFKCPTGSLTRFYATNFEPDRTGAIRISWTIEDVSGNRIQFHDNVNVQDSEYSGTGSNPPAGLTTVITAPSDDQIIQPDSDAIGLEVLANASQTKDVFRATGTGATGVKVLADGSLVAEVDPTLGSHVGDRDYNDARYAASSHTHTSSEITDFEASVSANTDVANNTAKVTNATHTGEVTGDTVLTISPDAIGNKPIGSFDGAKEVLIRNPASGNLERIQLSEISNDAQGGHTIRDEGVDLAQRGNLNFIGSGVSATDNDSADATDITITAQENRIIQEGGLDFADRPKINFLGPAVTITDNAVDGSTDITITGGTGGGDMSGPASATSDNIAVFDGATGKLVKDSLVAVSDVIANTAKISNATHTGEVTGDTALTINPTAISNKAIVSPSAGMYVLAENAGVLRKVDVGALGGGGGLNDSVKVSSNDATSDYLKNKIVQGNNIIITEINDGGTETLQITSTGGISQIEDATDVNITGSATGDILIRSGSEYVNLPAGTSGHVLKSNGPSTVPSWQQDNTSTGGEVSAALTGVAANVTDLGPFTGSTISDSNTIKGGMQELETAVEGKASSSHSHTHNNISDYDTELAGKSNTSSYTPTSDYHPATKKYVDDNLGDAGYPRGNVSITQGATPDIDWSLGDTFELGVLTQTNALTFSSISQGQTIAVVWTVDAAGSFDVTFPASVEVLAGGSTDTTANVKNYVYLTAVDAATTQHGSFVTDQASGGGGGATNWAFTSTSASAAAGEKHILSGASTVLTFPAAPADGTEIQCIRDDSTNVPAVARGGTDTINGVTTNMTLDIDQGRTLFVYDLTNTNWRAYNV